MGGAWPRPDFRESFLSDCFVRVGLAPDPSSKFVTFCYTKKGVLGQIMPPAANSGGETLSIGEVTSEVALTTRPREIAEAATADGSTDDAAEEDGDSDPPSAEEDGETSDEEDAP